MSDLRSFRAIPRRKTIPVYLGFLLFLLCLPAAAAPGAWTVVGPAGGDARAFAAFPGQPKHLLLGTTNSWLYESTDEGATWSRLAKIHAEDGFVIDSIVIDSADPTTIFVGAWRNSDNGGLWISHDGGRTWAESPNFKQQPVHALAQAPSDPKILIAGTLAGVFRSADRGESWSQISPEGSREIHEIESLAIDPADADTIYAGTWHLPWKTTDGGKNWKNIKQGIIEDSDVFSIIIDPEHTQTVYLSACSGIYKSENGGKLFRRIQGIPSEARRTRNLMQDPEKPETIYAGTTEGLYKTQDAGKNFKPMTDADVVVNAVYVDPTDSSRVLLATDRGGVLSSHDGGATFTPSNEGISERKIAALLVDSANPQRIYAGVVNDKKYGGVFRSSDGGAHWEQLGQGLDGSDVFSLAETKDGVVVAGTGHGIYVLDEAKAGDPPAENSTGNGAAAAQPAAPAWQPRNSIVNTVMKTVTETVQHTRVNIEKQTQAPEIKLESPVNAIDASGEVWVAATNYGLLTSHDQGASWQGGPVMGEGNYLSVTANGSTMVAARADGVVFTKDAGQNWSPMGIPTMLTRIHRVAFSADGTLWLGAREGVYYTPDLGKTWMWIHRLPFRDIDDLSIDAARKRILVSSRSNEQVYSIDPKTMTWKLWETGYRIVLIRAAGDRLVAASLNDGVLVGPEAAGADLPQGADAK